MSEADEAVIFRCDEAACRLDRRFYEALDMDERWAIIRAILAAAQPPSAAQIIGGFLMERDVAPWDAQELLDHLARAGFQIVPTGPTRPTPADITAIFGEDPMTAPVPKW